MYRLRYIHPIIFIFLVQKCVQDKKIMFSLVLLFTTKLKPKVFKNLFLPKK